MKIKMLIVEYIIQKDNTTKNRHTISFGTDTELHTFEVDENEWINLLKHLSKTKRLQESKHFKKECSIEIQYILK